MDLPRIAFVNACWRQSCLLEATDRDDEDFDKPLPGRIIFGEPFGETPLLPGGLANVGREAELSVPETAFNSPLDPELEMLLLESAVSNAGADWLCCKGIGGKSSTDDLLGGRSRDDLLPGRSCITASCE